MRHKIKIQREHSTLKRALEASFTRAIPFAIDDFERDILVWRTGMKANDAKLIRVRRLEEELRRLRSVDEVGVKDVKLVALHDLWWRIIEIVMRLVILVPIIPGPDTIEVTGLSRTILVLPGVVPGG